MYKAPFYLAEIQSSNCQVELLINNVPCFDHYNKGGVGVDWPINEYILHSGRQLYTIKVKCFEDEDTISKQASVNLKITLRDAFDFSIPKKVIKQHFEISFQDKKTQVYESGDFFEAEVPYTLTGWKNSFSFSDYIHGENVVKEKLLNELNEYYEVFHQIIKSRDINSYNSINSERFEEVTSAFYLTENEKEDRKKSILNSSKQNVSKIDFSNYSLQFYGDNNQLVGLKIKNQPCGFVFENDEGMIITELALFHRKINNEKISLIR
ncbi:hypothetical protein [Chryseobacterium sp. M5A1_1a]